MSSSRTPSPAVTRSASTTRSPRSPASCPSRHCWRSCSAAAWPCTTWCPATPHGRSNYRLAAIRPSQIGLADDDVADFVAAIAEQTGEFIQIVNYNLRGSQYAIAGTVAGLEALEEAVEERRARVGGKPAFILVPGIDVPFHSSELHAGVADFRATLDGLLPERIDPSVLVGRYIPNLVPRLFTLDKELVEEVAGTSTRRSSSRRSRTGRPGRPTRPASVAPC